MKAFEIATILNRQYLMLLMDSVTYIKVVLFCSAFKNISYNEWFFSQYFPQKPIMLGTLQVEAFTQLVALLLLIEDDRHNLGDIPILLAGIDKIRLYKSVIPSEKFDISTKINRVAMGIASASAYGSVRNEIVSECKITYRAIIRQ